MATDKKHYTGHRDRLRQRLLDNPSAAQSYELLELLLGYVLRRGDTKPLAKDLLQRFGNFAGLLSAHPVELREVPGVGPSMEVFVTLLREAFARYFEEQVRNRPNVDVEDIGNLARIRLAGCPHEEVWAALLDNGNRLITFVQVNAGINDRVVVSPRMAVELMIKYKATGLVLAHNHPGGSRTASALDLEMTLHLREVVESMGLRFIDHVIVTDDGFICLSKDHLL